MCTASLTCSLPPVTVTEVLQQRNTPITKATPQVLPGLDR